VFAWHTQHAARSLDVVAPGQQDFVRGSCVCACDQQRKLYVRHDWSDDSGVHFYSGVEQVEQVERVEPSTPEWNKWNERNEWNSEEWNCMAV